MEELNTLSVEPEQKEKRSFPFFKILYKNIILILVIFLAFGIGGTLLGNFTVKTTYTANYSVMLRVSYDEETTKTATDIQSMNSLSEKYMATLVDIIKTRDIISVAQKGKEGDEFYGWINSGSVGITTSNSLIFTIKYSDKDINRAKLGVERIIYSTNKLISERNPFTAKSVDLVQMQYTPTISSSRSFVKYIVGGFIIGAVLGIGVALLTYLLDNKMKDAGELEEITGTSLISSIPK